MHSAIPARRLRPFVGAFFRTAIAGLLVLTPAFCSLPASARAQDLSAVIQSHQDHGTPEWALVAAHLPDPATATAARLEMAADVLRARRFQADALLFYEAAMARGADPRVILKKMGITCLEMQQTRLARLLFGRVVRLNKRDGVAWNDMAAADIALGDPRAAIGEYRHAVKLERSNAVFHSNLALAYFEVHAPSDARKELQAALRLDPDILHRTDGTGYNAQVLSAEHFGEICLEMAHVNAQAGDTPALLEWLSKASERGVPLREAMGHDAVLRPWLADPRVAVLLHNHDLLSASTKGPAAVPSLGAAPQ